MPLPLRVPTITAGLVLLLSQGAAAAAVDVLPFTCLDKLRKQTSDWSVCTHEFGRNDERCKKTTDRLSARMQECTRKGYSKKSMDDAMTAGYRAAGKPKKT